MRSFIEKYLEKAYCVAYLLVAATLPLYQINLNSIAIILLAIIWLVEPNWKEKWNRLYSNPFLSLPIIVFFLLHILGLAYTEDLKSGGFDLEKKLTFLIFPMVIFSSKYTSPLKWIYGAFIVSISILMAWDIYDVILNESVMSRFHLDDGSANFRLALVEHHPIHATYRSIHTLFAVLCIVFIWPSFKSIMVRIGLGLAFALSILFLLLLASRIVMVSVLLGSVLYILFYLKAAKKIWGTALLGISTLLIVAFILLVPSSRARFTEIFAMPFTPPTGGIHNSTSLRAAHLFCDKELASRYFWAGVGPGDVQNHMDECYKSNHFTDFLYKGNRHNCHNQYFQSLISLGILGLLSLLTIYIVPIAMFRNKLNFVALYFMVTYICSSFTESVFGMQKGIVLFTLFYSLLMKSHILNRTINI